MQRWSDGQVTTDSFLAIVRCLALGESLQASSQPLELLYSFSPECGLCLLRAIMGSQLEA